jgi:hypothetical protein
MAAISLVTDAHVSKTEAIAVLETVIGVRADKRDPANPSLFLPSGSHLTIEVPKFGEDLPLTLDLSADIPEDMLEKQAEELAAELGEVVGWSCVILGNQPG